MTDARRSGLATASLVAGMLALPAAAYGQAPAETEMTANTTAPEIVVTAQKREERLLDVPIAVTVLTGEELDRRNISRFDELSRAIPNLQFEPGQSPNENSFTLRGISAATTGQGLQSSVGVYLDGLYVAGRSALNFDLFDVGRIELLRGPQGTLFGRNASAGALSIVSAKPKSDWGGYAVADYGDYNDLRLKAAIGGEVGGSGFYIKAAGSYGKRDGYLLNTLDGSDLHASESKGGRLYLGYRPSTGNIAVEFAGDYSREDNDSNVLSANPYAREVAVDTRPFDTRDIYGAAATVTIDGGPVTFTSITGYRGFVAQRQADNDGGPTNAQFAVNADDVDSISQELRFASTVSGRFRWLAGLYYYNEINRLHSDVSLSFGPTLFNGITRSRLREASLAVFGQADLERSPKWTLTLGGRYSDDIQRADVVRSGAIPPLNFFAGSDIFRTASNDFSFKIAMHYALSDSQKFYATVSEGYKSGGVNVGTLSPANQSKQAYLPEKGINYEFGYKASLADRKINLGLAAFLSTIATSRCFDPIRSPSTISLAMPKRPNPMAWRQSCRQS